MKKKFGFSLALGLVLAVFVMTGSAGAAPATLADLVGLGSTGYQLGDKLFYNFNYVGSSQGGGLAVDAASIQVQWDATPLNPGMRFIAGWAASGGQFVDSLITYDVKVTTPGMLIKDVSLAFNGSGFDNGSASVTETVKQGTAEWKLSVAAFAGNLGNGSDSVLIIPPTAGPLHITKDIQVNGDTVGLGTISWVDNHFSQTPVPIPGGFLLLGPGLAGLALIRRRMGLKA
jgi:hypothetical protein